MKLKNRLKILLCNVQVVLICIVIVVSLPLQFVLFQIEGKNRILKYLLDRIFRAVFNLIDVKEQHLNRQHYGR